MAPFVNKGLRKTLTLHQKVLILEEVDAGMLSKSEIAKSHNMSKSTLSTLIKSKDKIFKAFKSGTFGKKQKTLRGAAHPKLEECLVRWLKMVRAKKIPVDRKLLKEQAEKYALQLGIENFKESDGWITRFKERKNLTVKRICGESGSVDRKITDDWLKTEFKEIMKKYEPKDIYNADETGLFFKALPDKTLAFKDEECSGGKKSKERITLLVTSNMDGSDKLPLLVIGKSKNPRCFKGMPKTSIPTDYTHSKNAWMTMDIWEDWLRKLDKKCVTQKRKICLIVDNCSAHGEVDELKAVEVIFLPPNCTSVIQPMDQGIIQAIKNNYRKALCRRILLCIDCQKDYKVNLLSAMGLVVQAWKNLSAESIANCFRHAGFKTAESSEPSAGGDSTSDDDVIAADPVPSASCSSAPEKGAGDEDNIILQLREKGFSVPDQVTFDDFVKMDQQLETSETISDEQIVASVLANDHANEADAPSSDVDSDADEYDESAVPVKTAEAVNAIRVLRAFYCRQADARDVLEHLDFMENDLAVRKSKNLVQKTLLDYMTK